MNDLNTNEENELKAMLNEPALRDAPANPQAQPEASAAIAKANVDRPMDRAATAAMIANHKAKCKAMKDGQTQTAN